MFTARLLKISTTSGCVGLPPAVMKAILHPDSPSRCGFSGHSGNVTFKSLVCHNEQNCSEAVFSNMHRPSVCMLYLLYVLCDFYIVFSCLFGAVLVWGFYGLSSFISPHISCHVLYRDFMPRPEWFQLCLVNLPFLWYLSLFPFVFDHVLCGPFSLCALSFSPQPFWL